MKLIFYLFTLSTLLSYQVSGQDLVIKQLNLQSDNISLGGSANVYVTVQNKGKDLAQASKVGFYLSADKNLTLSDTYLGEAYLNAIFPESQDSLSASIKLPDNIPANKYYLFAFADYTGLVFEKNEKNNSEFKIITLSAPTVDLSITAIYPGKTSYIAGDQFGASVYERNDGNSPVSFNYIGYYLSNDSLLDVTDILMSQEYVYSVYPNSETYTYTSFYLPANLTNGDYYIIAEADFGNNNAELNESNNLKSKRITITDPVNDLSLTSFTIYSDSSFAIPQVKAGESFYSNATIVNSGTTFLSNVSTGYYLSSDSVFGIGDTYIAGNYIGWLYSGNSFTDNLYLPIPSDVPSGKYYIISVADNNLLIEEPNEDNNTKAIEIFIKPASIDLSLYNFNLSYPASIPGSYNYVNLYEFNTGTSYALNHNVSYFLSKDSLLTGDDRYLSQSEVSYTGSGSYNYLNQYFYIPDSTQNGNYYVIAVADYSGVISETNEDNNTLSVPLSISSPFIDLTTSIYGYDTTSVYAGAYLFPSVVESNIGNVYADYHYISYYLSSDSLFDIGDTFLTNNYVNGLYGGNSNYYNPSLQIPSNVPAGEYYIISAADYPSYITESNEDNNAAALKITVIPANNDLTISFTSSDSIVTVPNGYIYPSLLEQNLGSTYAAGHVVSYYLSNDPVYDSLDYNLTNENVSGLSGGSAQYLNPGIYIPSGFTSGTYYIVAKTDNYLQVEETNELNNTSALKIVITPNSTDLSIYNFSVYPNPVTPGGYVSTSLYEFNNGTAYAPFHYVGYYLSADSVYSFDDYQLGYDQVSQVDAGSYAYVSSNLYIPYYISGNYYIIARADNFGYINEYDETNNDQAVRIRIAQDGTDLKISSLSVTNTNPYPGNFVYLTATESNVGNISAGGHFIGYYLSTDSVYNFGDTYLSTNFLSGLNGNNSVEFNPALFIPNTIPYGEYYLIAIADYGYGINEVDEFNNTRAIKITIGQPVSSADLIVYSLFPETDTIRASSNFYLTYKEYNNGSSSAGYHDINFYLSSDTAYSFDDSYLGNKGVYGLNAFSSVKDSSYLNIPYWTSAGRYFIIAVADINNNVFETNENNNYALYEITVAEPIITGIEDLDKYGSPVKIYPNPGNGLVNFTTLANTDEIEVSDLNSMSLLNIKVQDVTNKSIDLTRFGAGVYLIKTKKEGVITSNHKLIITK